MEHSIGEFECDEMHLIASMGIRAEGDQRQDQLDQIVRHQDWPEVRQRWNWNRN